MEQEKRIEITKMVLAVIGLAGFLSVALVAPNAVQMFGVFLDKKPREVRFRFNRAIKKLKDKGLIKISHGKSELTSAGKKELARFELKNKLMAPQKWDGKWRIVAFDIWERRRSIRDAVRNYLHRSGFVRLQNSMWVYPYDCREVVDLLKTYYKVRPAVLYIVVESLEDDDFLKRHFDLGS